MTCIKKSLLSVIGAILVITSICATETRISLATVGTHTVPVSVAGVRTQFVSIPFLKSPIAHGRIDSIDSVVGTITDNEGAFSTLSAGKSYILRITSGDRVGAWFSLAASAVNGNTVAIEDDGIAGFLDLLEGDEAFSINELFTLEELLPTTHPGLTAGPIDLLSTQVHVFDGREFIKVWLSNGTITEEPGWTYAVDGELRHIGEAAVLPGTSFIVVQPTADKDMSIRVHGVVLNEPINIPIGEGFNYVSVAFSTKLIRETGADYSLDALGLASSGFKATGEDSSADGDRVFDLDPATGRFTSGYLLDGSTGEFVASAEIGEVTGESFAPTPGTGFVIYNSGEPYQWTLGN